MVRTIVASPLQEELDLIGVGTLEREDEHVFKRLHGRDHKALRPPIVVKVVGRERVVSSIHGLEDLSRRLLATQVLVCTEERRRRSASHHR